MSILWRSWITFTAIIATVLIVLALLSCLQHNALFSNLIRQRLSVVAQTTADSFQPVVNLGLPISMVRNAREILVRAQQTDSRITAIHAFNPTGIIVQTTGPDDPSHVPDEVTLAQSLADSGEWSVESDTELFSGISILEDHLQRATENYETVRRSLGSTDEAPDDPLPVGEDSGEGQSVTMTSAPETSLARVIARKLVPWAGLLIAETVE